MNAKKIIKGIVKLGVVGGIAFAAYKLGECNGEVNERMREKYGDEDDDGIGSDDDEDDYRFYDNMDEPDDWCLAPASGAVTPYDIGQEYTISEEVPAEKCCKKVRHAFVCSFVCHFVIGFPPFSK